MTAPIKLKADVMWAFLERKNEMSDKYQLDLCNLSPAATQALKDLGVDVKHRDDKGDFITCKSSNPIIPLNKDGHSLEGVSVGNGSKAIAVIGTYNWTFRNKEGVSPSLRKLVITDLVTYEDPEQVTVDDDDDIL